MAREYYPYFNESLLIKEFDIKTLDEFLYASLLQDVLEFLQNKEKQKVVKSGDSLTGV
ncbi:MAG: hypothetical protein PHU40_11830 [Sulfurimonas sp.]|nr:hypothetical protein [Sulfurimonas sp.]